jgi:hypothetical protein
MMDMVALLLIFPPMRLKYTQFRPLLLKPEGSVPLTCCLKKFHRCTNIPICINLVSARPINCI